MVMKRGASFLVAEQLQDGSWQETTRPSGGKSHAQWISTSAWARASTVGDRGLKFPADTDGINSVRGSRCSDSGRDYRDPEEPEAPGV